MNTDMIDKVIWVHNGINPSEDNESQQTTKRVIKFYMTV